MSAISLANMFVLAMRSVGPVETGYAGLYSSPSSHGNVLPNSEVLSIYWIEIIVLI